MPERGTQTGPFVGNVIAPIPDRAKLVEVYGRAGEGAAGSAELDPAVEHAPAMLVSTSALLDVFAEP